MQGEDRARTIGDVLQLTIVQAKNLGTLDQACVRDRKRDCVSVIVGMCER